MQQENQPKALWSRIALPKLSQAPTSIKDLWVWQPHAYPLDQSSTKLRRELRNQGWRLLPPSRTQHLFCLMGQLLPLKVLQKSAGDLVYWVRQIDMDYVGEIPVALAFPLPEEMGVDPMVLHLPVNDPFPPLHIGKIGLVVEGHAAQPYPVETLGNDGIEMWKRLGEQIMTCATLGESENNQGSLSTEVQDLARQLARLYWQAHQKHVQRTLLPTPMSPNLFLVTDEVLVPAAVPIQGVLAAFSNASSGATQWQEKQDRYQYTYKQADGTTSVEVRADPATTLRSLWQKVRTFSDLDGDVFLILLAQALNGADQELLESGSRADTTLWIRAAQILDYRGIQPIIKKEESTSGSTVVSRRAGHRQEDIAQISACMERLSNTWITVQQYIVAEAEQKREKKEKEADKAVTRKRTNRGKKQLLERESLLMIIEERMRQRRLPVVDSETLDDLEQMEESERSSSGAIAWKYRLGTWITPFLTGPNPHMGWLCQKALKYNTEKELLEKRLARYFLFHLRIYASSQSHMIIRTIRTFYKELSLPIDARNPERTRQRFQKALDQLVADGQLSKWEYMEEENPALPKTQWLQIWLDWKIRFSAAPPVVIDSTYLTE